MDNLVILRFEIILVGIFLLYCIYYLSGFVIDFIIRIKNLIIIKKQKKDLTVNQPILKIVENKNTNINQYKKEQELITEENKNKIKELLKKIAINISKAEYDLAKNLIVEGLTIDKFNIELNLELASIFILEQDYHKAEYIYKDLLLVHKNDFNIFKKLAYILTMQEKYDMAIEMYKKAYNMNKEDFEIINMLAHLHFFKNIYIESIYYLKKFLKQNPKNSENLILLGSSYRAIGKINDSINTFKRVLEIQPYNEEIKKEIEELVSLEYGEKE